MSYSNCPVDDSIFHETLFRIGNLRNVMQEKRQQKITACDVD